MSAHSFGAEVIERDANDRATQWLGTCKCKERFADASYEAIEDKWRIHVHGITGNAPRPMGGKEDRWTP